jgi:hypothetical protein
MGREDGVEVDRTIEVAIRRGIGGVALPAEMAACQARMHGTFRARSA